MEHLEHTLQPLMEYDTHQIRGNNRLQRFVWPLFTVLNPLTNLTGLAAGEKVKRKFWSKKTTWKWEVLVCSLGLEQESVVLE